MTAYHNPWIPEAARESLAAETGTILDVGGGAAPYYRAAHIIDIQEFDAARLRSNAWGGTPAAEGGWTPERYTRRDICD